MTRFTEVVCPPDHESGQLVVATVNELESYLGRLPRRLRLTMIVLFIIFDQQARFARRTRFRRFVNLDLDVAEEYVGTCLTGRLGPRRTVIMLLKGIVTFNYYELPQVKERLGYLPAGYIARVSERRLSLHGDDIRRGEAALLSDGDGT